MATTQCELLTFSISDINKMKQEFLEAYETLFYDTFKRLCRTLKVKLNAMRICQKQLDEEMQRKINKKMNLFMKKRLGLFLNPNQQPIEDLGEESDEKAIEYDLEVVNLNTIDIKGHSQFDDHTDSESSSSEDERQLSSSDTSSDPKGSMVEKEQSTSNRRLTFIKEESKEHIE